MCSSSRCRGVILRASQDGIWQYTRCLSALSADLILFQELRYFASVAEICSLCHSCCCFRRGYRGAVCWQDFLLLAAPALQNLLGNHNGDRGGDLEGHCEDMKLMFPPLPVHGADLCGDPGSWWSAALSSALWQRRGLRERHGAVSGKGCAPEGGGHGKGCQGSGHSLTFQSSGSAGTPLSAVGFGFEWCCVDLEVWLSDPCGSHPNWDTLWFHACKLSV